MNTKTTQLKTALTKLSPLFRGGSLDILGAVRISTIEGTMILSTNNLDTYGEVKIECSGPDGEIAVNGNRLLAAVLVSDQDECQMRIEGDGLHYQCGGVKMRSNPYALEELPVRPPEPTENKVQMDGAELSVAVRACIGKTSKDTTRPILNGICFEGRKDGLRLVATEGHMIIARLIEVSCGEFSVIVPNSACEMMKGLYGEIEFSSSEKGFCLQSKAEKLIGCIMEGNFPNWRGCLPLKDKLACSIAVNPKSLIAALTFAALSDSDNKEYARVRCDMLKDEIALSSKCAEHEFRKCAPATTKGQIPAIAFAVRYAKEILSSFDKEVTILFADEYKFGEEIGELEKNQK